MTFTLINVVFLGAAVTAVVAVAVLHRPAGGMPPLRALGLGFLAMAVLTMVFDNVMIAARLFDYDDDKRLGILLGRAPIEDFAYPLGAVILLAALWWPFVTRSRDRDAAGPPGTGTGPLATRRRLWDSTAAQILLASRPLSWVNTAFPFAMAYLFTTRTVDAEFVVGTLFFLIPYNLLMYGVNDVFDHESDKRNPRKGGAEGALLDESLHRATLLWSVLPPIPFALWLLAQGSVAAGAVLLVVLFAVVAYSAPGLRFKERPVLDSATSSTHFVGPCVYGFVLAGAQLTSAHLLILAAFFLWGMAAQAFGAVQDIGADRAGGLASIGTVFGAARTVRLALTAWALAALLLMVAPWPAPLAAVVVLPYVALAWPFRNLTDEDAPAANRGWRRFLAANYAAGAFLSQILIGLWQSTA